MAQSALALSEVNGVRFGRLTALRFSGRLNGRGRGIARWEFRCECGNVRAFPLFKVRRGLITNCGCQDYEEIDRSFSLVDLNEHRRQHGKFRVLPLAARIDLIRTEYKNRGIFNHAVTPFDLWLSDPDTPFQRRHVRVVERARDLWRSIDRPANEITVIADGRDGLISERAKNLLRRCRNEVTRQDWHVFENVIRWNEPYGFPGSRLWAPSPAREATALRAVLAVAETISRTLVI